MIAVDLLIFLGVLLLLIYAIRLTKWWDKKK